jgi:hypothetical protein
VIAPLATEEADWVGLTNERVELMEIMPCAMSEVGREAAWLYMDDVETELV